MELRNNQNHNVSFQSLIQTRVFRIGPNGGVTPVKDAKRFYNGVRELGMYLEKRTPNGNNPRPDIVRAFRQVVKDYIEPGYGRKEGSLLAYGEQKTLIPFIFTGPEAEAIFQSKSSGLNSSESIRRFVKRLVDPILGFQFEKQEKPISIQIYTAPNLKAPRTDLRKDPPDTLLDITFEPYTANPLSARAIKERLRPKVLADLVPDVNQEFSLS